MSDLVEPRLRRPLLGVVGAVAVAVLTVSGCAAGQDAQTVEQTSVVDGTAFEAGAIALRDVGLRAPADNSYAVGSTAYLEGIVVNQNAQDDQLVSVSSPVADQVVLFSDGVSAALAVQAAGASASASSSSSASSSTSAGAGETSSPTEGATPSAGTSPTASASATGSPSAGSTAASTGSAAAAPEPIRELDLPTNKSISFGYDNQQLAIAFVGLKQQLFPSNTFEVTFTFAKAGSVTKTLFVKLPVDSTINAPTINTEEGAGGGE